MEQQRVAAHPYQEMAAGIASQIDSGDLAPETRLPSVRALAKQHEVSAMTAQKALNQLVQDGYAQAVSGLGYFVKEARAEKEAPADSTAAAVSHQLAELQNTVAGLQARVEALENRP
ncbi:winged helix-turn-helix domain-containing protein [Saccharopolyspora sp. NFXS83]|uniref:GntR family transcriptional regulator n=1 Tax=Saccharopolyspora sp. NFXS83 TaxID=2993560 RepID=UPI00224A6B11|nr:winged helix-turn-helix domain-containing protein [Saccharopolyspora sp. NFXS83]MCX2734454.1 winged helix-turn-helix domain-containing protein [Saccharopolyspora sp. NFXS83]